MVRCHTFRKDIKEVAEADAGSQTYKNTYNAVQESSSYLCWFC